MKGAYVPVITGVGVAYATPGEHQIIIVAAAAPRSHRANRPRAGADTEMPMETTSLCTPRPSDAARPVPAQSSEVSADNLKTIQIPGVSLAGPAVFFRPWRRTWGSAGC